MYTSNRSTKAMATKQKLKSKNTSDDTSLEKQCADLEKQNSKLSADVTVLQRELLEVRDQASSEIATAQARLYWMDKHYLGPENFEKRAYVRVLVRGLALMRRVAAYLRRIKST